MMRTAATTATASAATRLIAPAFRGWPSSSSSSSSSSSGVWGGRRGGSPSQPSSLYRRAHHETQLHQHRQHRRQNHAANACGGGGGVGDCGGANDNPATTSECISRVGDPAENEEKSYHLAGRGAGAATHVTARDHRIAMDVPKAMGGKDAAPQPVELLLAALMGCEQATAGYVARSMKPRFPLRGLTFQYQGFRDNRGAISLPINEIPPVPAKLTRVAGVAVVHLNSPEPPERIDELRRHVESRCPVASTLAAAGCRLDIRWRAAGEDDVYE